MMITINLLPVKEWRQREAVKRQIILFFIIIAVFALSFTATIFAMNKRLSENKEIVSRLEFEKRKLLYVEKKMKAIRERQKEIDRKFSVIERLQKGRLYTVRLLDEIVTSIPIERLYIDDLTLKKNNVTLSGNSIDNHTVALFMKRLKGSSLIKSVTLGKISKISKDGHDMVTFNLTIIAKGD